MCQPRGNGGLDQSDSNKGDEKCQILKIELPGFDDSINVERLKEEPEDTMFFWTCYQLRQKKLPATGGPCVRQGDVQELSSGRDVVSCQADVSDSGFRGDIALGVSVKVTFTVTSWMSNDGQKRVPRTEP